VGECQLADQHPDGHEAKDKHRVEKIDRHGPFLYKEFAKDPSLNIKNSSMEYTRYRNLNFVNRRIFLGTEGTTRTEILRDSSFAAGRSKATQWEMSMRNRPRLLGVAREEYNP
jgi:hypothetical protein